MRKWSTFVQGEIIYQYPNGNIIYKNQFINNRIHIFLIFDFVSENSSDYSSSCLHTDLENCMF